MIWTISLVCLLALVYLFLLHGRSGRGELENLRRYVYAHRGLHGAGRPENSMVAFEAAVERGYGMELDVHLLADGELAVIHDSALKRTTGAEGSIEELTLQQLQAYHLENTEQTIPAFTDVLKLVKGRTPLIIELKTAGKNYEALTQKVCQVLKDYPGPYCIESFDPRCIRWLKKNRPDIIRGQLSRNFLNCQEQEPWLLRFAMTGLLFNFLTAPDFVAFKFTDRKNLSLLLVRKLWGVQGVAWTLETLQEQRQAAEDGWISIFEGFTP